MVLLHVACAWQLGKLTVGSHSSMSIQLTPLPVKPSLHAQVNDPVLSAQVAFGVAQVCAVEEHSFTFEQDVPEPAYPGLHVQVKEPTVLAHVACAWQLC